MSLNHLATRFRCSWPVDWFESCGSPTTNRALVVW